MREQLQEGKKIRLGGLGDFSVIARIPEAIKAGKSFSAIWGNLLGWGIFIRWIA